MTARRGGISRGYAFTRDSAYRNELPELPHNFEAECAVLGVILLDNSAFDRIAWLNESDFFHPTHKLVFAAMLRMRERSQPIDLVPLRESLPGLDSEQLAYVETIGNKFPRSTNVEHYARIIREKSLCRGLAHSAAAVQEAALSGREDVAEILARLALTVDNFTQSVSSSGLFHSPDELETALPLDFAIDGFLQCYAATMLGGLSGHGKTLILLSIAKALLAGEGTKLWDLFDVKERGATVVYLIPECTLPPFAHRLRLFRLMPYVRVDRLLVRTLTKGPTPSLSDPQVLAAVKATKAHVILDTAVRFSAEGRDENSATDNQQLATDIFRLLGAGARSVIAAHHAPKPFAKETVMRLENCLRGSGDVGAMVGTCWAVKQLDRDQNIIHVENVKPRDFQPCAPFQLIGRPSIDETGDFGLYRAPGACGSLADEQEPERDKGGAPVGAREAKAAQKELLREWLGVNPNLNSQQLSQRFRDRGIKLGDSAIRKYRKELEL